MNLQQFVLLIYLLLQVKNILTKDQVSMTWRCDCRFRYKRCNSTPVDTDCHSYGVDSNHRLEDSNSTPFWSLSNGALTDIVNKCFLPHNTTLKDISIAKLKYLDEFEKHAFTNLRNLQSISVSQAPALRYLPQGVFFPVSSLRVLRLTYTGLECVPTLPALTNKIMHLIDFESNKIKIIGTNSIKNIRTEQLLLAYNSITKVESWAFNGSSIGKFDLSETAITFLPVVGLEVLEKLRLEGTNTLKIIPSIHDFKSLRVAELTYSFHCCAFKYPARHNPARHELHVEYLARVRELCGSSTTTTISTSNIISSNSEDFRVRRDLDGSFGSMDLDSFPTNDDTKGFDQLPRVSIPHAGIIYPHIPLESDSGNNKVSEGWTDQLEASNTKKSDSSGSGVFHKLSAPPATKVDAFCGNLTLRTDPVECWPKPDALNPCEDIMGYEWLRISVWLVISTALFGNTAVLIVLLANRSDTTVPRFLMMNLAFSDLLMAVYLFLLAFTDLQSTGIYFNYAFDWQRGYGCKIAGAVTVFSSQLSIYTLTLITIERWFAIRHALYANVIDLKCAIQAMIVGWVYSVTMAVLPLFGISSYSTTSICLPMDVQDITSMIYVLVLLSMTGIAFVFICICYVQIYLSLGQNTRQVSGESSVARKMMLLVGTNFACYAPIAFFSVTAVFGYPLIDVTRSKILLVFFYPINSCANPYLYAIMTAQYRKQLIQLLSRFGLCTEFAQQYKMVYQPQNAQNTRPSLGHSVLLTSHASEDAV